MSDRPVSDLPPLHLDDQDDREELRSRYYGLLQELRVLLPGVQVLVAFLLTAPLASGFDKLDALGRRLYLLALMLGLLAIVAFVTPTAFHRLGRRTRRAQRLHWSVRATQVGLAAMALALITALFIVARVIFGTVTAAVTTSILVTAIGVSWLLLPHLASGALEPIHEGDESGDRRAEG